MKKLYLFMTMLLVSALSFGVNARTLYLDYSEAPSHWSTPQIYAYIDDNNKNAKWPGEFGESAGEKLIKFTIDDKYTNVIFNCGSETGGGNNQSTTISGDDLKDNYVYTVTADGTNNCKVSSQPYQDTPTPPAANITYFLDGDAFGGWNSTNNAYKMDYVDGKYVKKATIKIANGQNSGFGLRARKSDNINEVEDFYRCASLTDNTLKSVPASFGVVNEGDGGTNWKSDITGEFTFTFDPEAMTLTIEGETQTWDDLVIVESDNANFSNADWKASSTNGIYVWSGLSLPAGKFKIGKFNGSWADTNYGTGNTITVNSTATIIYKSGGDCVLAKAVNNATVTLDLTNTNNYTIKVEGTEVEDVTPGEKYYCYFINSNNWTTPTVWAWVSENDKTSCNDNTNWPGDAMTQKDGKWYWEAPAGKVPGMILISDDGDGTKRFETTFVNGATYKPNGDIASDDDFARVYFNPGADFYNNTMFNQSEEIYAQLLTQNGTAVGSRTKMVRLTGEEVQLPFFYIDVENPQNYGGIRFETKKPDGSTLSYTSNGCPDYDQERWYMFIYNCGDPAGRDDIDCYTAQTYLTYKEYEECRNGLKPHLFYIGGNIKGLRFWKEAKAAEAKDGVFLFPIGYEESTDADDPYRERSINNMTFKMSWIDADTRQKEYNAKYGTNSTGINNRWWATFNLGLVGPNPAPGQTFDDYMALGHIANLPQLNGNKDGNYSVKYLPNRTRRYSRYNNYNWWVSVEQLNDAKAQHYIVVDTKYQTTALIPFNPRPTLTDVTSDEIYRSQKDLASYEDQLGNFLIGCEVAGEARINKANQLQGSAKLKPSEGLPFYDKTIVGETEDGKPGYELEYSILMGDEDLEEYEVIGTFPGNPDALSYEIKMKNMAFGADKKIFVRCTYHDLVNQSKDASGEFYFRSMVLPAEITAKQPDVKAPQAIEGYIPTVKLIRNPDGSWSAHVETEVELAVMKGAEGNDLAVYPDFELESTSAGDYLRLATTADWHTQAAIASAHHTIYESGDYIHNVHNWAEIAHLKTENDLHRYKFNFVFENIAPAGTDMEDPSYTLKARIYAQYPMLIDNSEGTVEVTAYRNGDFTDPIIAASTLRRKANGTRDAAPSYSLSMIPASTELEFEARKDNLSGITDPEVAEDGEAELYNLQGIRVQGEPAPGIYLRRCGNTTEKVVIR